MGCSDVCSRVSNFENTVHSNSPIIVQNHTEDTDYHTISDTNYLTPCLYA